MVGAAAISASIEGTPVFTGLDSLPELYAYEGIIVRFIKMDHTEAM